MDWLLPLVLGAAALAYICAPLLSGASETSGKVPLENWHTVEQLDIDREMGKIDQDEYEELKPKAPTRAPVSPLPSLEALISGVRHQKRAEIAVESEVLIARARRRQGGKSEKES